MVYEEQLMDSIGMYGSDLSYYAEYKVRKIVENINYKPKKILEFGCGIGRNIPYLQKYFPDASITGYDNSREDLLQACFTYQDVKFLHKLGNDKYDLVLIANVFHHIKPKYRLMIMRVVKTIMSGDIFIFEHNPNNPLTVKAVKNCPIDKGVRLLKPVELIGHLRESGINMVKMRYCLFFPSALKQLSFMEKYLSFIPLGGQYFVQGTIKSVIQTMN